MASASASLKRIIRLANNVHVGIYRISGGKFANQVANMPLLLLTSYGRKSGKPHTNPVAYIKEGEDFLISASAGGMDWHPGWYFNLKKRPEARIQIGRQVFDVRATILAGEERTRMYEQFKAASSNFVKYEKGTNRLIPVIRLSPVR